MANSALASLMLIIFDMQAKYTNERTHGMTLLESLVIMVLLAILVAMLAPAFVSYPSTHQKARRISCVCNLKEVGTAFRIWENDHLEKFPMQVSTNAGGSKEYAFGPEVFHHFQVMENELGQATKLVVCPADKERFAATNFISFGNSNLSYFVGLGVSNSTANPDLFLSGDRNIINGIGARRNRLWLTTNDAVGWALGLHTDENYSVGNIMFPDGSVQMYNTQGLRQALNKPGAAPAVLAVP